MKHYYIIDFDSTFTQVEALDELSLISLENHPARDLIYKEIERLTNAAMEGRISFRESLSSRVKLLEANKVHLEKLVYVLKKKVSASFLRNKDFFKEHSDEVLIVSGGFKEFITPIVTKYGIQEKNVYANTFKFDEKGNIAGYDESNPLSEENGKVKLLKQMQLDGTIYGIGDGYSDFQLKESGLIEKFYAFTENIERKSVTEKADHITPNFDEFLYVNHLPRAISYPKNRISCLIVGKVPELSIYLLKRDGFTIRYLNDIDQKELKDVGMMLVADDINIPKDKLGQALKLKTIGYLGNSKGHVDRSVCNQLGIVLFDNKKGKRNADELIPKRMINFINKGDTEKSSNFPNMKLPRMHQAHRLIHIHHNVPGIMAQINNIFAENHINIVAQFLMTKDNIGYVITDISKGYDEKLLKELKKIDTTIKLRILY